MLTKGDLNVIAKLNFVSEDLVTWLLLVVTIFAANYVSFTDKLR